MKKYTCYYKRLIITFIRTALFATLVAAFFLPSYIQFEKNGENYFTVKVNGDVIGAMDDVSVIPEYVLEIRKEIASKSSEMVLLDLNIETVGKEVIFGKIDSKDDIMDQLRDAMNQSVKETLQPSYTVKVNEYTVNLASIEEVNKLLQASINKYDSDAMFEVNLAQDSSREFNVLTTQIKEKDDVKQLDYAVDSHGMRVEGIEHTLNEMFATIEPAREKDWDEYDYGLKSIDFAEEVEVVESYLSKEEITPLDVAIEEVTKDQEKNTMYEVVSGDTLLGISMKTNIPIEKLIELNENLKDENSIIHVGDELIITVPEPELSIEREEELYYEEEYDEEIIYIDNDDWYTTQTKTLQEPSAGFRKVVAIVQFRNDKEIGREIVKEEVVMKAVPKIVERGTKIPPTYIKPLSGGVFRSGFGRRRAPKRGASTYHRGVDWSTPTGSAIYASSGGTVAKAGWGGGYGYVIYINHADGRQTRYAHLSKVLVRSGQHVDQGEKIGLSGSTGISTGPHLHFEILINGRQVNPLKYLN